MFGFGKKKDKDAKKKSKLDKLIMGAIVGGAVGSVIGMSIAPQKGKETREYLAQKGKDIIEKGIETGKQISDKIAEHQHEKPSKKGIFRRIASLFFGRKQKKSGKTMPMNEQEYKKIPHEVE